VTRFNTAKLDVVQNRPASLTFLMESHTAMVVGQRQTLWAQLFTLDCPREQLHCRRRIASVQPCDTCIGIGGSASPRRHAAHHHAHKD